jgi:tetratricopeptide (TPR) repeat protein
LLGILAAPVYFTPLQFLPTPNVLAQNMDPGYVGSEVCASCHQTISETYKRTGMSRSFYRPSPTNLVEDFSKNNTFYHKASDSHFTMLRRDGKFYQRRHQIDSAGKQINVIEKQIDYILGSGNHVRAYVHRTAGNKLIELPLAWYTEKGGYWGMNPGYDQPTHDGFRRALGYDCMFCHNSYPKIPAANHQRFAEPVYATSMPEGIDCQRCHGPGRNHVLSAKTAGATREKIRNSIVNPTRLGAQRIMEVCMQCHLETTSFPLPNALQRYGRGPFSYQPSEPLSSFMLSFDHAPGQGRDDKFEIVNSAYRLRRSACFLESQKKEDKEKLTCITCHNPHDVLRGAQAQQHYTAVCRQCHGSAFDQLVRSAKHTSATSCTECHMPKRRTEDVVHVVMTDHYIQRHKPSADLLAEMAERHETDATAYRGPVVPYYPPTLPSTPENDLDLAVAQVIEKSNLSEGIKQLTAAITKYAPQRAEYYLELAEALRNNGQMANALPLYEEAVRRSPKSFIGLQKLGVALRRSGKHAEAVKFLQMATSASPGNAITWHELGLAYRAQGKQQDAVTALRKATALDPDMSEAHNNLGIIWFAQGKRAEAESAFREAIRIQPEYADAHGNLGNLLFAINDLTQARYHFVSSLRLRPDDAVTRYNYAMILGRTRQFDAAQLELEAALRVDPKMVDAHLLLGDLLMAKDQAPVALPHYREAVRLQPESGKAHLSLGSALASVGDVAGAIPHLQKAAADADPGVRQAAAQALSRKFK